MASSTGKEWLESIAGAARIAAALVTPMRRARRARWGATDAELTRSYPGDDQVPNYSPSFANKLVYGPALLEPISHVMDCKMLLGTK